MSDLAVGKSKLVSIFDNLNIYSGNGLLFARGIKYRLTPGGQ